MRQTNVELQFAERILGNTVRRGTAAHIKTLFISLGREESVNVLLRVFVYSVRSG